MISPSDYSSIYWNWIQIFKENTIGYKLSQFNNLYHTRWQKRKFLFKTKKTLMKKNGRGPALLLCTLELRYSRVKIHKSQIRAKWRPVCVIFSENLFLGENFRNSWQSSGGSVFFDYSFQVPRNCLAYSDGNWNVSLHSEQIEAADWYRWALIIAQNEFYRTTDTNLLHKMQYNDDLSTFKIEVFEKCNK